MRHAAPYDYQYRFSVTPHFEGKRLIDFYLERFQFFSEEKWREIILSGDVTINYEPADPEKKLQKNDVVRTIRRGIQEPDVADNFEIISDENGLLAINKPAPLPVHPSGRYFKNCLLHILRERYPEKKFHPLHRLDAWTTGCLLLGTDSEIAAQLHQQFDTQQVEKSYGVLAYGNFGKDPFTINLPIGRLPQGIRGCGELATEKKEAVTHFTPLAKKNDITFLKAVPITGRTNQIRVHIQAAGGWILNDPLYGKKIDALKSDPDSIPFLGLHCYSMKIHHPQKGSLTFVAPWPQHFLDLM